LYVVLTTQTDMSNAHILSYVLDSKQHLSAPKESKFAISPPLVSIAAFPSQLFLLFSSGDVKSLSFAKSGQPSALPVPVLVESQIAQPLSISAKDFKDSAIAVPTVTATGQSGTSTALSIPSMSLSNSAMLTAGQINGVPHLFIGDPANHRILNLESSTGGLITPTSTSTTATTSNIKLQLDQQYVSYSEFKQMKSLAVDKQGDQLGALAQDSTSIANLVAIQTSTQNATIQQC
jgi:hypothetical protein